jgi:hypothetical protein
MGHFQIEKNVVFLSLKTFFFIFVRYNRDSVRYNQENSIGKSPEPTKDNFLFAISGSSLKPRSLQPSLNVVTSVLKMRRNSFRIILIQTPLHLQSRTTSVFYANRSFCISLNRILFKSIFQVLCRGRGPGGIIHND